MILSSAAISLYHKNKIENSGQVLVCHLLNMTNRNPIRQWSITFPQSGEVSREQFALSFPPAVKLMCCMEEHKEGGLHLHLGIKLKKGITKSKLLRWIERKWPNDYKRIHVQATRNVDCWQDYLSKEDPDPYLFEDRAAVHAQLVDRASKWLLSVGIDPLEDDWFNQFSTKPKM